MSRELIGRAALLIKDPRNWMQGALACDAKGKLCEPIRGWRFDAIGAVYHAARVKLDSLKPVYGKMDQLACAIAGLNLAATSKYKMSIEMVNDTLGHEAVMDCMRIAWQRSPSAGKKEDEE